MQILFPSVASLLLTALGLLSSPVLSAPSPSKGSAKAEDIWPTSATSTAPWEVPSASASSTPSSGDWNTTSGTWNTTTPDTGNSTSPDDGSSSTYGSTPAFVVYTDRVTGGRVLPPVSEIEGYTVVVLSFLLAGGAADQAAAWAALDDGEKHAIKNEYNAAGVSVIVSAFGATDSPTSDGADPVATANWMAQFVLDNQLDGIDVDYEDLAAMNARDGRAEEWLVTFTKTLREKLPKGHYLLTHAPVAPWFSPVFNTSGAYLTIHQKAGDLIDWYNVQFYNQGEGMYTTCDNLLTLSGGTWPGSSLLEIAQAGVPLAKLVIGKYAAEGGGASGFMEPHALGECAAQARKLGWGAGIMTWQYPEANSEWIKAARGTAFPL
ncbi:glycoside hydrolase superfamily [Trametes polyzona]|nr:glycoside hydrolase superfamily [Trametes polyzona]